MQLIDHTLQRHNHLVAFVAEGSKSVEVFHKDVMVVNQDLDWFDDLEGKWLSDEEVHKGIQKMAILFIPYGCGPDCLCQLIKSVLKLSSQSVFHN